MKRNVLALVLALIILLGLVAPPALGEKSIDNLFPANGSSLALPNEASFFGASIETGAIDLPDDDHAWSYAMYESVDKDALERYRARLYELGYEANRIEQGGTTIWACLLDSEPALVILATDGYAAVCRRDDLSYQEEAEGGSETPIPAEGGYAIAEVDGVEMTFRQEKLSGSDEGKYRFALFFTPDLDILFVNFPSVAVAGDSFTTQTDAEKDIWGDFLAYESNGVKFRAAPSMTYDPTSDDSSPAYPDGSEYIIHITSINENRTVYEGTFSGHLIEDDPDSPGDPRSVDLNGKFRIVVGG